MCTASLLGGLVSRRVVSFSGFGTTLLAADRDMTVDTKGQHALAAAGDVGLEAARRTAAALAESASVGPFDFSVRGTNAKLEAAVDAAFAETDEDNLKRTRAMIVLDRAGRVLAERYAEKDGFSAETVQHGWSMTKSVLATLIGMRVLDGKMSLESKPLFPEWADDERRDITLRDLLTMTSGLEFNEVYGVVPQDATRMLFLGDDVAEFAKHKPLEHPVGSKMAYSSGTTNLLSELLRQTFDSDADYWAYPAERLFAPLGMSSAVMEVDPKGTFIGSSFSYATPLDWARYGMLFLQNGHAPDGTQLLPDGWVDFTRTPTIASQLLNSEQEPEDKTWTYGGQWWTNSQPMAENGRVFSSLPADAFCAHGYQHQVVMVVPSADVVIVRLGLTFDRKWDLEEAFDSIITAL